LELAKSISVIIPNYNGKSLLQEYLPKNLEVMASAGCEYEIIIVDDASKDDSVEFIRTNYPAVKLVTNTENQGFSYSCNRGIETAKCELILLLNSGVKLTNGYFDQQWKYFLRWDTFGVMGRITDMDGDHIQTSAGVPKFNGFNLKTDYFYYSNSEKDRLYTFYLSCLNALIDAKKLKELDGFSELFATFYCDDIELSIRAWRLRWKCYYEHKSICRHIDAAPANDYKTPRQAKSENFRNWFYLQAIHLNGMASIGWFFQVTFGNVLPRLIIGQTWIWKSYSELLANRKGINDCKQHINNLMEKNDSHVSIFNVVNKIRNSVKNKKYARVKA
jgi:GT2 family glycosyltransferase